MTPALRYPTAPGRPLSTAEDVWFWYSEGVPDRGRRTRSAPSGLALTMDDVWLALRRVQQERGITHHHVKVLELCGRRGFPPHPMREPVSARLWAEAMDALEAELDRRGVIESRAA